MHIYELPTPAVLVDLNKLENNVRRAADLARKYNKKLWPMVKTHKSLHIAKLQKEYGAEGFLCGTLDEAEALVEAGLSKNLMLGYPIVDKENLLRVIKLVENGARVILRVDSVASAELIDKTLTQHNVVVDYVVKVDVGQNRLGVKPEKIVDFVKSLSRFRSLKFVGIATHPGHAYRALNAEEVRKVAKDVALKFENVVKSLRDAGYELEFIGTGSTPTFRFDVNEPIYTHLFPGNYVYYDRIQALVFGSAELNDCALTVLATVISIPEHSEGRLAVINAGSKTLSVDRGAHGIESIKGFGHIVEHPKTTIVSLSEEIGVVDISTDPTVKVGEKVNIIPNHSCIVSNATSYLIAHRNARVMKLIKVDMRNNVKTPEIISSLQFL